ncbi:hypothetical protein [Halobacillus seohaensis]|uniref:Uncharacterized protein n=1 Tax=Halobacillus seohaensis TaxID=447421 RepID=A0ABW2EJE3_9BACI
MKIKVDINIDIKLPDLPKINTTDILPWLTLGAEIIRFFMM